MWGNSTCCSRTLFSLFTWKSLLNDPEVTLTVFWAFFTKVRTPYSDKAWRAISVSWKTECNGVLGNNMCYLSCHICVHHSNGWIMQNGSAGANIEKLWCTPLHRFFKPQWTCPFFLCPFGKPHEYMDGIKMLFFISFFSNGEQGTFPSFHC